MYYLNQKSNLTIEDMTLPSNKTFIWLVKNSSSILEISEHGLQSRTGSTNAIRCKWTLKGVQFLQNMFPHLRQWCWNKSNYEFKIMYEISNGDLNLLFLNLPCDSRMWILTHILYMPKPIKDFFFLKNENKNVILLHRNYYVLKFIYLRIQNPLRFCKFPWRRVTRSRTHNLQTTFGVCQSFSSRILHNDDVLKIKYDPPSLFFNTFSFLSVKIKSRNKIIFRREDLFWVFLTGESWIKSIQYIVP